MKKNKKKAGSVLIVSIMILAIVIIIALSISLTSIREEKNAVGESGSSKALQMADEGVEKVMNEILKEGNTKVGELSHCDSDGVIRSGDYAIWLYDSSGSFINCSTAGSTSLNVVFEMKSVGTAMGQSRAIQATVVR